MAATDQSTTSAHSAAPGSNNDLFTFWPRHQAAIYKALNDRHTYVEREADERAFEAAATAGDGVGGAAVPMIAEDPLESKMILNLGPQHPATHGALRIVCQLDGETVDKCLLDLGYLHRGIEKLAEVKTYQEFMPYTDRMDYMSPYSNNVAWCLAVEKLAGIEVPERAQWLRTIGCELARISAHLLWAGTMVMDAGALSVFLWTFKYREEIYSIFDEIAGARFTVSHSRIGGLAFDFSDTALAMIAAFCDEFERQIADWKKLLNRNRIWVDRNKDVGILSADEAIAQGYTGPNLRASGVPHDIRLFEPYLVYDQIDFDIPMRTEGDSLARYFVRIEEMEESVKIIRQCLEKLPQGPVRIDNAKAAYPSKDEVYYSMEGMIHDFMMTDTGVAPPKGAECYHAIESPKGELGFFLVSDGTGSPWRVKANTGSFSNLQGLETMMEGAMVADTVVLIGSIDPVIGDSDK
ncbi:NADH dehydrogenase (quinone) subunit D [Rubrivirga sp. S365]|uniref:NADH-quinone oxidoreductase subunit D n=1 Tax=Rubrivirga litoralis TaxID=3075598 RepID=A0ABU3BM31_9BACT|nr:MULTISPECIES: NADH dehydrogenase (quinone) subunit D [unclassified Rubrivirga]MDT0630345.1 NADH dehydrogenase (quinone) subunit D [Rubrivirga sp. F394]MDT7855856.1 NADH dehydrogenase (quinone) subunit D [Rubrivirga sp. S365]